MASLKMNSFSSAFTSLLTITYNFGYQWNTKVLGLYLLLLASILQKSLRLLNLKYMSSFTFHMQHPLFVTWTLNLSTHCHLWHSFWISDSYLNKIKQMKGSKNTSIPKIIYMKKRNLRLGRLPWSESHENHFI